MRICVRERGQRHPCPTLDIGDKPSRGEAVGHPLQRRQDCGHEAEASPGAEHPLRVRRLGAIEEHFDALPFDAVVARECGRLHALLAGRGGAPRRRAMDLAIAATANVHGVPLMTYNIKDLQLIADKVNLREH
jgi:hypothetical protein